MGTVYTDFAELPVPDDNGADDVPAWFTLLANSIDPKLLQYAVSTSDRDARYYSAPAGTVCVVVQSTPSLAVLGMYVKTDGPGTASWDPVWEPTSADIWTDLQIVNGYESRGLGYEPQVYRETPKFSVCKGAVVKSDGNNIVSSTIVAYLPSGFAAAFNQDYGCATTVSGLAGSRKISVSATSGAITYYGPDVLWVSLDVIRFFNA